MILQTHPFALNTRVQAQLARHVNYFKRLCLLATLLAFCVVVLGAYVRLTDAGLGCPDWPGCYGTLTVPESEAAILKAQTAYPQSTIEVGKAWREMLHRYLAGTLGILVFVLFGLGWRNKHNIYLPENTQTHRVTSALLVLISFQAMLGMWTVTMLLKPAIVSAHLLGGMATLSLLVWLTVRHIYQPVTIPLPQYLNRLTRFALVVLFGQILLGGWTSTNYAALACTDFPTCHGAWWPAMDFKDAFHLTRALGESATGGTLSLASLTAIQWTHRLGALITFIYIGMLSLLLIKKPDLRYLACALLIALLIQVSLGIANLVLHLPLVLAVLHNAVAALLVVIVVTINAKITQLK